MRSHIVVFGMGDIGSAIASLLRKNKHAVDAWDKSPGRVNNQKSLFEVIPRAEVIFLCVPSWCLPAVVRSIRPFVHKKTIIVGLSKGLQGDTRKTTYEFLSDSFQEHPILILGGAMLANELQMGLPGFGILA
ncbi:MAG: NAD(P)-binding domain-containing protein, partial [Patescibacteria group bacterium]